MDYHDKNAAMNLNLYGNEAPSYSTVKNWFNEFNCVRWFREGHPKTAVVSENIDAARELIMQDRHAIHREIDAFLPPAYIHCGKIISKQMVTRFFGKTGHVASVPVEHRRTVNSEWYTTICSPI